MNFIFVCYLVYQLTNEKLDMHLKPKASANMNAKHAPGQNNNWYGCYRLEPVAGKQNQCIVYVAYPSANFEEGYVTNMLTSIVQFLLIFSILYLLSFFLKFLLVPKHIGSATGQAVEKKT